MPRVYPAAFLIAVWSTAMSAGGDGRDWRPVNVAPNGAVVVPVTVGGEGPFAFLIDTGSSRSAISFSLARRLAARTVGGTTVLTPSGRVVRSLTALPRLSIDGSPPAASLAMILPDEDLARGVRADGIIGTDVLTRFVVTIDYDESRLVWNAKPSSDRALAFPLTTDNGRWILSVASPACAFSTFDCMALKFIPDTGADAIVLFTRRTMFLPFVTLDEDASVRSLAGVRTARRVRIGAAALQNVGLHGQTASLVDLPAEDSLGVDGLLPLHLFARVTIDGPRKELTLVPR